MLEQAYAAGTVAAVALAGLVAANLLYDRGADAAVSRSLASAIGGGAFLLAVLWMDPWPAVAVAGASAGLILGLRLKYGQGLRGTDGHRSGQSWSQVTYAGVGAVSLAIGWGMLGDRWLAFLPIAFVAWGDAAAGLARATAWRGSVASLWPSAVMLTVCLAAAALFQPYWIGAVGATVAAGAERYRPKVAAIWDDNVNVAAASIGVMAPLTSIAV